MKNHLPNALKWSSYAAAIVLAAVLPAFSNFVPMQIIETTYGKAYLIYEMFGFCTALVLCLIVAGEARPLRPFTLGKLLPLAVFFAVSCHFLQHIVEYSFAKAPDYRGYELGAQLLLQGKTPYEPRRYVYPPLLAEVLAGGFNAINAFTDFFFKVRLTEASAWNLVYYFYQTAQFWLTAALFVLARRLVLAAKERPVEISLFVGITLLCDNALLRTLRHGQVNLWLLDFMLAATLLTPRWPFLAGLMIAPIAHLKIYPVILLMPWALMLNFRALAGAAAGIVAIVLAQTAFFTDTTLWRQYLAAFAGHSHAGNAYRDNALHSLIYNFSYLVAGYDLGHRAQWVARFLGLVAVALTAWRLFERERSFRLMTRDNAPLKERLGRLRVNWHMADTMALTLLVSPLVWEHHYVFALPLVFLALVTLKGRAFGMAALASAVIVLPPTFDVFPLSYHRLAGLLLLLWATRGEAWLESTDAPPSVQ